MASLNVVNKDLNRKYNDCLVSPLKLRKFKSSYNQKFKLYMERLQMR